MLAHGVVSLDEHRAQRSLELADEQPAVDRAYALDQARRILDRLGGGHDQLAQLPRAGEGPCGDCHADALDRFTVGTVDVCRACATSRLNAGHKAALPQPRTEPGGATGDGWYHVLIHWTKTCALELTEHELRGRLNSYRLTVTGRGETPRYLLSNDQKRTLIRLHRKLRDHQEHGGDQRPSDLEAWVRGHADRLTITELERRLNEWHVTAADRYELADLLSDRRRQLGLAQPK